KPDYALEAGRQGALEVWRLNHLFTDLASFSGVYQNARIDALYDDVLEQWRPDVVHVQHLIGLSTGILERTKRRGIPLVLTLPDAIVTPSRFHREMYARYGVDLGKAHVLPCGLATASFAGMARPPAGHFRVGFLGTLIPSKGAHVLLEAYRLLGRPDVTLDFH